MSSFCLILKHLLDDCKIISKAHRMVSIVLQDLVSAWLVSSLLSLDPVYLVAEAPEAISDCKVHWRIGVLQSGTRRCCSSYISRNF